MAGALAGCGEDGSTDLASLTPPDTPLYAEAVIRPDGDQAEAIESLAERVAGVADPGSTVPPLLDEFLAANGIEATYADDIEPWLGDRAAMFVSSFEATSPESSTPDFGVLVAVDDADAAREFLEGAADETQGAWEERSYEGTDYFSTAFGAAVGVVDDATLVLGTEAGFQVAVDSSAGESLADSSEYAERMDALSDDGLASVFFEPGATVEAILASENVEPEVARMWTPLLGGLLSEPIAATVSATPDSFSVDLAAVLDTNALLGADPSLLTELPGDSWLAIAVPELGPALDHGLDQLSSSGLPGARELERRVRADTGLDLSEDVLSWLGDTAGFLAGTSGSDFSAGVVAKTTDPAASKKLLDVLEQLPAVETGVAGDEVVAVRGSSVDEVLDPAQRLGDAPAFQAAIEALGDDLPPGLYLDLPSLFAVAEQGSDGDIDYDAIRPYTQAFASLIAGSTVEDGLVLSRFTVSLAAE